MHGITDADRQAAEQLRVLLADICGFWHRSGDDGPLCEALARHRHEAEQRLMDKLNPVIAAAATEEGSVKEVRVCEARPRRVALPLVEAIEVPLALK